MCEVIFPDRDTERDSALSLGREQTSEQNIAEEDRLDLYTTAMKRPSAQATAAAVKKKPPDQDSPHRQRHHPAAAMEVDQPSCQDEDNQNTTGTCRTVPVSRLGSATQRNPGSPRVGLTNRVRIACLLYTSRCV